MIECMAIIPCRVGKYAADIIERLHGQGAFVTVVRDRNSIECPGADAILDNSDGDGFLAGKCRDLGVDYALMMNADAVIFIDEDCIPQDGLVKSHMDYLGHDIPIISIGRRLEDKHSWKDPREIGDAGKLHLFSTRGTLVQSATLLSNCLATWTCNLGINTRAVRILRRAMLRICGKERLFHPAFDGMWGGEDAFLGYVAWAYRIAMAYLPYGDNAVKHMDHPRPSSIYNREFTGRLATEVETLKMFLHKNPPSVYDIC